MMKKHFLFLAAVAIFVLAAAAIFAAPAQAGTSEHCPAGGTKYDGSGSVTVNGVEIYWGGPDVFVSGGEAEICIKASTQNSGKFWLTGGWHVWWMNNGGQTPDISYLVVYGVKTPTPPPPTATPVPTEEPEYSFQMEGHRDCVRWSVSEIHAPSEGVVDVSMDPAWTAEWLPGQTSVTVVGTVKWSDGHMETTQVIIRRPLDCDETPTATPPTETATTTPPTVTTTPPTVTTTPPTVTVTIPPQETPRGVVESAPSTGVEFPLWTLAFPLVGAAVFFLTKKRH